MAFDPQKFFIGIIDFFSVLLPGALLTYTVQDSLGPALIGARFWTLSETQGWVLFLFTSYLLGHFIFLIGAATLDSYVYDPLRSGTERIQVRQLAEGKTPARPFIRRLARWLFKPNVDELVERVVAIKKARLGPLGAARAINSFQWSKARLGLEHPNALATVERFEAASKFFRSLVIVLTIIAVIGSMPGSWMDLQVAQPLALVCVPLGVLALWRYVDQRAKATSQAYRYIISLEASDPDGFRAPRSSGWATHAGGVVYRMVGQEVRYLLMTPRRGGNERVLPKGHIEPGETAKETAVREVREEAAVWARIREDMGVVEFSASGEKIRAHFYLLESVGGKQNGREHKGRSLDWWPLVEALIQPIDLETRDLLKRADQVVNQLRWRKPT